PKGEEAFEELHQELKLEKTGTTKVPKRKNVYPDFEPIPAKLQGAAKAQVNTLSQQLNLKLPQDRVLSAPWVGRVRDAKGKPTSVGTSAGWLRNESRFWKEFKARFPDDYALIGKGHTVTPELAQKYGWDKSHIGDKLVHHHINNGSYVVAIPEKLHHKLSGTIHAKPTIMGE
ncbi:MAG: hypothetical protein K8I82_09950, partial [Anaerolineae bacterium]|nr:hypothetical protein [Anaerolineae bacterium]